MLEAVETSALRFENGDQTMLFVEVHFTVVQSKEGVIATHADIFAWVITSAALAQDNVTGDDRLATEFFNAETLAVAVASVL